MFDYRIFASLKRQPSHSASDAAVFTRFSTRILPSLLALCAFVPLSALPSAAQSTATVTIFTDTNSTDSSGNPGLGAGYIDYSNDGKDLRYALQQAIIYGGDWIIKFDSSCTTANPCTIRLTNPLPPITSKSSNPLNLTIDGEEFGQVIIDGAGAYRVFFVDDATVTLANLQIQNALAQGGSGGLGSYHGGGGGLGAGAGLFVNQSSATVTILNTYFYNDQVIGGNGGWGDGYDTTASGGGGGMAYSGGSACWGCLNGGGGGGILSGGGQAGLWGGGYGGSGGGGAAGDYVVSGGYDAPGGSSYGHNPGGLGDYGTDLGGIGGFGGGGGGGGSEWLTLSGTGGSGGFGGGGGGTYFTNTGGCPRCTPDYDNWGLGGFGGGDGGGGKYNTANNGGAGSAYGPAIFNRSGSTIIVNSGSYNDDSHVAATVGSGSNLGMTAPGADSSPVYNYGGNLTGALPAARPATSFSVTVPTSIYSGAAGSISVTAVDSNSNATSAYNGTANLSVSCNGQSAAVSPTSLTFTSGTASSGSFVVSGSGTCAVTAADSYSSYITGTSSSFQVLTPVPAVLSSPSPGSAFSSSSATFQWTAGSGVSAYMLLVGTTGAGSKNLYNGAATTATQASVSGLPTNATKVYARLYSEINGSWTQYNDYIFNPDMAATLISPTAGTTLAGSSQTFTWTAAAGATTYTLYLGSTGVGSGNLLDAHTTSTSVTATGLPVNGETIYARVWTELYGVWKYYDYTFKAQTATTASLLAMLSSPAQGATLSASGQTFTWTAISGATSYNLYLGASQGAGNLYNAGQTTATTVTTGNLPVNGATIYARLWTNLNNSWKYVDYTFTAATPAALTSPTAGATLAGASQTFTWTAVSGATSYSLYLGTSVGAGNLLDAQTTNTTVTANNLPVNGGTIYARLFTNVNGSWTHTDYTFTAASPAALTSPAAGATLAATGQVFNWAAIPGVTSYTLYLGTSVGTGNLLDAHTTSTSVTAGKLPTNGETIYARLWTNVNGVWTFTDSTFTAQ